MWLPKNMEKKAEIYPARLETNGKKPGYQYKTIWAWDPQKPMIKIPMFGITHSRKQTYHVESC